jgi:hypothetical protein
MNCHTSATRPTQPRAQRRSPFPQQKETQWITASPSAAQTARNRGAEVSPGQKPHDPHTAAPSFCADSPCCAGGRFLLQRRARIPPERGAAVLPSGARARLLLQPCTAARAAPRVGARAELSAGRGRGGHLPLPCGDGDSRPRSRHVRGGSSRILLIEQMSLRAAAWPGEFFTPTRAYATVILGFTALSSVVARSTCPCPVLIRCHISVGGVMLMYLC